MRITCEICGSYADLTETPINNVCPICLTTGSVYIDEKEENE